jgi:signal transduction histidine kinase
MLLEDLAAKIRSGSAATRYAAAFGVSFLVFFLRFSTDWDSIVPLVTLYPAVLLAAWLGGRGPGLLTCSLCGIIAYRDLLSTLFNTSRYGGWIALILFVGIGAMMVAIIDSLAKTKERLEEQSRRLAEETAERARTEERLRAVQEIDAAEAASRAKDAFLAMVSHDLRTPLQSIVGAVQVLHRLPLPKEAGPLLPLIERNAQNQARLLQDLIDLSRISAGGLVLNRQPHSFRSIVEFSLKSMQPKFDEKQLKVSCTTTGQERQILIDSDRVQQVVSNLISNSAKFTEAGGSIRVHLDEGKESHIELTISDSGTGIDPELLPNIFLPFRQGDTRARREGMGVGLAIVKNVVELHGGTVEAQSPGIGAGSTFIVRFPFLEASPVQLAEAARRGR